MRKLTLLLLSFITSYILANAGSDVTYVYPDFTVDGIHYKISGNQATVFCKALALGENSWQQDRSSGNDYTGHVVIPPTVTYNGVEYTVTKIGNCAMQSCNGLLSVTIPPTITEIGQSAFEGSENINAVYISDLNAWLSVSYDLNWDPEFYNSVEGLPLYYAHNLYLNGEKVTQVEFPEGINRIGNAISYCDHITSVTIPSTATSIDCAAFYGCNNLKLVKSNATTPPSVTYYCYGFFDSEDITLIVPKGYHDRYANDNFWNMCDIKEDTPATGITLNYSDASIIAGHTLSLTATISPVYAVNKDVTWNTSNNTVATVDENGVVTALSAGHAVITATAASNPRKTAQVNITVTEPIIASNITLDEESITIGDNATFQLTATITPDNTTDKTVTWSTSNDAVATVDDNGLVRGVAPGEAVITASTNDGSGVTAQAHVTVIEHVYVSSVTLNTTSASIDKYNSIQLTVTVAPDNATNKAVNWSTSDDNIATVSNDGLVTGVNAGTVIITASAADGSDVTAQATITVKAGLNYTFYDNKTAHVSQYQSCEGDVVIPATVNYNNQTYKVTEIERKAFNDCHRMYSLTVGENVTSIGDDAFYGCIGLTTLVWNAVNCQYNHMEQHIDEPYALPDFAWFKYCPLSSITIGANVKSIPACLGYNQQNLTSIVIPEGVTQIGDYAFAQCSNLTTLEYNAISVNYNHYLDFNGCNLDSEFAWFKGCELTSLKIGDKVQAIPGALAVGQKLLTSVEIPNSVTRIGDSAFKGCTGLTSVVFPEGLSYLSGFNSCTGLTSVTLPANLSELGSYAFANCTGITSITLPEGLVILGEGCLENTKITSIRIPASVSGVLLNALPQGLQTLVYAARNADSMYEMAGMLDPCTNLSSLTIEEGVESLPEAFATNKTLITELVLPSTLKEMGTNTFVGCNLSFVKCNAVIPPAVKQSYYTYYNGCFDNYEIPLYIPLGAKKDYESSEEWSKFSTIYQVKGDTIAADKIFIEPKNVDLRIGETKALTPVWTPEGSTVWNVSWVSDNPDIATVDKNGVVTAISEGHAQVSVQSSFTDNIGVADVYVTRVEATSITLDATETTVKEGETVTLSATVLPENTTYKAVEWESSDIQVAMVNDGVVTGLMPGTATITATTTDGTGLQAQATITVTPRDNHFTVSNYTCTIGDSVAISLNLENKQEIAGFQTDIILPEGFSIATNQRGKLDITANQERLDEDMTLSYNVLDKNTVRIVAFSVLATPVIGHSGEVCSIKLVCDEAISEKDYILEFSNIILTETNGTRHITAPIKSIITTKPNIIMGDANNDKSVDVSDVIITANKALGKNPEVFVFDAADVNKDKSIDVSDVILIANIAIGKDINIAQAPRTGHAVDVMTVPDVELKAGGETSVNVNISNNYAFAALQMNMKLPYGVEIKKAQVTGRADGHILMSNRADDGSVGIITFAPDATDFTGNSGSIMSLTLKASADFDANGTIEFTDIRLAEGNGQQRHIDNVYAPVTTFTGINDVVDELKVYAAGHDIVIDSPCNAVAHIVFINGMTRRVDLTPGHNVCAMENDGVYMVNVNGKTFKVVIK